MGSGKLVLGAFPVACVIWGKIVVRLGQEHGSSYDALVKLSWN